MGRGDIGQRGLRRSAQAQPAVFGARRLHSSMETGCTEAPIEVMEDGNHLD